ncbi:MAG: winged helix-turn-helix transcriptional regulator [Thaumarchaeota archaeon]|nr:winged helix-turn-helix transcriptional regulator [Nitrososphaerota archaeon]
MPFRLDDTDIAVLESLLKDGRKSFRQISREIGVTTPTVKQRYEKLVNMGLIKGVMPVIDLGMIENKASEKLDQIRLKTIKHHNIKISKDAMVKMVCDYCKGPMHNKPHMLKIANLERFFCCTSCRSLYKEKYKGRIDSLASRNNF